jgi:GDP-mannose 6-dehydrogenase
MRVSIFGLGYVGAVSLACLARDGHDVIGVDIDDSKLRLIREGRSPIVESGILELMERVVASGRVTVSSDANDAVSRSDISFVCVGTPSKRNGDQDLAAMTRLAEELGDALASKEEHHTIVIRSTVQPGTIETVVKPILEKHSGGMCGENFSLCFQPEFLREGSSIRDYDNPPMTVVGSDDAQAIKQLRDLFGHLPCAFISTDMRTAETLKYACNTFHALKISFANEIGRICQSLDADSHKVMNLVCEDRQLNISSAYLRPGFAFGGSCLPKDLRALLYMAKQNDVDVPMLSSLLPTNRLHIEHALEKILARDSKSVAIIGLSFKSGTDDLRESPLVTLVEQLIGKGYELRIYDPEVRVSRLIGANKKYIDQAIPHIGELMHDSMESAITGAGTVVVGLNDSEIAADLVNLIDPAQYVLDLVGLSNAESLAGPVEGICW